MKSGPVDTIRRFSRAPSKIRLRKQNATAKAESARRARSHSRAEIAPESFPRGRSDCRLKFVRPLLTNEKQIDATSGDLETYKCNSANRAHSRSQRGSASKPGGGDNVGDEKEQYREN
jgi:hypothetical protein